MADLALYQRTNNLCSSLYMVQICCSSSLSAETCRVQPVFYLIYIFRCPLAPTLLLLAAAGIVPSTFPLIDTPPQDAIKASLTLLKELGMLQVE